MYKMAEMFSLSSSFQDYTRRYRERLAELLEAMDAGAFDRAVEALDAARQEGRTIFVIGNGGSAAAAAHLVNDLVAGAYLEGAPSFRAFALSDNVSTLTALANDSGYESVFEHQLKVYMRPGDVVLAMSVSGNSPNILRALEYARNNGGIIIGLCGLSGGKMAARCNILLHAATTPDEYGPVEDVFSIAGHLVSGYLAMKCGKQLHH